MNKKLLFLLIFSIFIIFATYSKGIDFTVGGSHRIAFSYAYDYSSGFAQLFSIPVSFSYYPGERNFISFGARNKFGYGLIIHENSKVFLGKNSNVYVSYDTTPLEHEIYENLSFILKLGSGQIKYIQGVGCSLKGSFISFKKPNISIIADSEDVVNYKFEFFIIEAKDYQLFTIGPSIDFNLEILNESKNFSFIAGLPVEFLFPTNKVTMLLGTPESGTTEKKIDWTYINKFYFNLTIGLDFTFSFNMFKSLDK